METPFIIGLTGGIASGKTASADILQKLGAYIIDADVLARQALEPQSKGERQIKKAFPEAFNDKGQLDRRKLRSIAFADANKADVLDRILHPIILKLVEKELKQCKMQNVKCKIKDNSIILVAPLLFEAGLQKYCNEVWQISADADTRIKRAAARDNVTIGDIQAIMARQLPDTQREKLADRVIVNNKGLNELERQIIENLKLKTEN